MVGALSMVTNDILPYTTVVGERAKLSGLNIIGLKRRGVPTMVINDLRRLYKSLFKSSRNFKNQAEILAAQDFSNEYEDKIISFILSDTNRSFLTPKH